MKHNPRCRDFGNAPRAAKTESEAVFAAADGPASAARPYIFWPTEESTQGSLKAMPMDAAPFASMFGSAWQQVESNGAHDL